MSNPELESMAFVNFDEFWQDASVSFMLDMNEIGWSWADLGSPANFYIVNCSAYDPITI